MRIPSPEEIKAVADRAEARAKGVGADDIGVSYEFKAGDPDEPLHVDWPEQTRNGSPSSSSSKAI